MQQGTQTERMGVVGAGLVGSLWALMLAQRGHRVAVFERRPDPRKGVISAGRSINLALSERGWRALERAGIAEKVREIALPIAGRLMHSVGGVETFQPYGLPGATGRWGDAQCIYSVSRARLNRILIEAAEAHEGVNIHFGHVGEGMQWDAHSVTAAFRDPDGAIRQETFDRLFGTDGAFSAVRERMQRTDRFDFEQQYLGHGYRELEMKPREDGGFRMREDALHIWPRGGFMLMALPNPDGTFTCTLFAPYDGPQGLDALADPAAAERFFAEQFPDVLPHFPDFAAEWSRHPTSSLVMVRCHPWHRGDRVVLMGDAAHAIVPFYGQGMNCGFEDCTVLSELLDGRGQTPDWGTVFSEYTALRKPAGDAILELALRNYVEMRDKTGDPRFLLQKRIESLLATRHPGEWVPLYTQVTFSHTPYHEALAAGKRQDAIMAQVMDRPDIAEVWDAVEVTDAAIALLRADKALN
ncbi:MAG: hypothetical protein RJA19_254 [Bacteroidota bacterium]|jgi:kynurenine 3-monooxygenase